MLIDRCDKYYGKRHRYKNHTHEKPAHRARCIALLSTEGSKFTYGPYKQGHVCSLLIEQHGLQTNHLF